MYAIYSLNHINLIQFDRYDFSRISYLFKCVCFFYAIYPNTSKFFESLWLENSTMRICTNILDSTFLVNTTANIPRNKFPLVFHRKNSSDPASPSTVDWSLALRFLRLIQPDGRKMLKAWTPWGLALPRDFPGFFSRFSHTCFPNNSHRLTSLSGKRRLSSRIRTIFISRIMGNFMEFDINLLNLRNCYSNTECFLENV